MVVLNPVARYQVLKDSVKFLVFSSFSMVLRVVDAVREFSINTMAWSSISYHGVFYPLNNFSSLKLFRIIQGSHDSASRYLEKTLD